MKLMRQVIEHHREYHQFDRKRKYANRTYERKKQFYGQEKPDEYDLLVKHYRRAILEAINQIPNHKRKILQDKYFVVTYDTKSRVFEILGLKNAQVHRDKDHRGRLQEISSKKNYLHNRLKFRNTAMLEEF